MSEFLERTFGLRGRVALVTGGSSGIGHGIARALGQAGAKVVLLARDARRLDSAAEALRRLGVDVAVVAADLADTTALPEACEATVTAFGEPDILVTAAGVNPRPPLGQLTSAQWQSCMTVNLEAPFALGQRFGPVMAERGFGRIINIGSQQSFRAFGNSGAYGVSKAGVVGLTRSQAEAWSPSGVCCNALIPGYVRTPLTESGFATPGRAEAMAARTFVGRNGTPDDLEGAAVFLAGRAADYVTGQAISVDGGLSAS